MRLPSLLTIPALLAAAAAPWSTSAPGRDGAPPAPQRIDIDVVVRVDYAGMTGTWAAVARALPLDVEDEPPLPPGRCVRDEQVRRLPAVDTFPLDRVTMLGAIEGDLPWDPAASVWRSTGPRRAPDAAWGVGGLEFARAGDRLRLTDAVRFPGVPDVEAVWRGEDGEVHLSWKEPQGDVTSIHAVGPSGVLRCGVEAGHATVPWWAIEAAEGTVLLRTTRTRVTTLPGGMEVRVRAAIDREVHADRPARRAVESAQPTPSGAPPRARRRSDRPPRPFRG